MALRKEPSPSSSELFAFNVAAVAAGKARRWAFALHLLVFELRRLRLHPDVFSYGACIGACELGLRWTECLFLLRDMRRREVLPNVVVLTSAATCCEKAHRWDLALQLLGTLGTCVEKLDVFAYSALVKACERSARWAHALQFLDEAKQSRIQPTVVLCSAGVSACEKGQQWERALLLLARMRGELIRLDVVAYNASISACEKGLEWRKAVLLMDDMEMHRLLPDVVTFGAAMTACEKAERWPHALQLFVKLRNERHIRPSTATISAAIGAHGHASHWAQALGLLRMAVKDQQANVALWGASLAACEKGSRWQEGLQLLSEMGSHKVKPNAIIHNTLLEACWSCGETVALFAVFTSMAHIFPLNAQACSSLLSACEANARSAREARLLRQHTASVGLDMSLEQTDQARQHKSTAPWVQVFASTCAALRLLIGGKAAPTAAMLGRPVYRAEAGNAVRVQRL